MRVLRRKIEIQTSQVQRNQLLRELLENEFNLSNISLSDFDFSGLDLSGVDFLETDFKNAIFLKTDLRLAQNLTQQQFIDKNPPLLCNSPLPADINVKGGKDRDCGQMATALLERYPVTFETLAEAEAFAEDQRQKVWE